MNTAVRGESIALVLVAGTLAVAASDVRLPSQRVHPVRRNAGVRRLEPRTFVDRDLRGHTSHTYELTLESGQFARVVVEQRGIDVVVTLTAPDGHRVAAVDRITGTHGREQLMWIAERDGPYRVDVTPARAEAPAG